MRRSLIVTLFTATSLAWPAPAQADNHACRPAIGVNGTAVATVCRVTDDDEVPGSSGSSPAEEARATPAEPMKWVTDVRLDAEGEYCTAAVAIPIDQEPPPSTRGSEFVVDNDCPQAPPAADAGTPAIDPQAVAYEVWVERAHPQPAPQIPPGEMIVGLPAYLVSNATMTDDFDQETVAGPLSIRATSELWVDWGDGSGMTGPHDSAGDPWPDGKITNVYRERGSYDVTVVQRWRVEWSFDDANGVFYQDAPPVVIQDFPVGEIQAVVTYDP